MSLVRLETRRISSAALVALMVCSLLVPIAGAVDTDGDGVDDSVDDCIYAPGNSTVDRDGCPDTDGDGTSDWNDRWSMPVQGWTTNSTSWQGNTDIMDAEINPDGTMVAFAMSNGYVRIHLISTKTNFLSRDLGGGDSILALDWSPDGTMIAATIGDGGDHLHVMHSTNLTDIWNYDIDTGGNDDAGDVEFSPDSTYVAYVMGRANTNNGVTGLAEVLWASNGTVADTLDPSSVEDAYDSVAWSPDGTRLAIGGRGEIFIHAVGTWSSITTYTIHGSGDQPRINGLDWSPDGNWIAACDQYAWSGQGNSIHVLNATNGQGVWDDDGSTSCLTTKFSPDSRQVAVGWNYYQSNGNQVIIYETTDGTEIETLQGPCSGGCGTVEGLDWSPNAQWIISGHGRDNERAIWWRMDPDVDLDGYYNDVDDFPNDGTQWADSDNDGYGDNPPPAYQGDECPNDPGTSTEDRFGCPDADGDGWSDQNDDFPSDIHQWSDADGDGYPDNVDDPRDPNPYGVVDRLPNNPTQWNDTDLDGYGDNFADPSWVSIRPSTWPGELITTMTPLQMNDIDAFPEDEEQWNDTDGDWIGDEPFTSRSDGCPMVWGNSSWDRLGCVDTDGDGWSDPDDGWAACVNGGGNGDAYINDPTQWCDGDGDGFGDNASGTDGDACPGQSGSSYEDRAGCRDADGDGWSNTGDPFPSDPSQWSDQDNDGCGDNLSGNNPDLFQNDSSQCGDRDGDGKGDYAVGENGDWFPDDNTQWYDRDGDGYGDNPDGNNPDMCPDEYGRMTGNEDRGCPDTDEDGVADNLDAFPENPMISSDRDNDTFADDPLAQKMDDCPDTFGTSNKGGTYGCPDSDGDGWADSRDLFPNNASQWEDSDEDGYGDNWGNSSWNSTRSDEWPGEFIEGAEMADAFPLDGTQWNDTDGDGWGDEANGSNPDEFPYQPSQWRDSDGDGYGDNTTRDAYQPDDCRSKYGTSTEDRFGCEDTDGDGWSDLGDICIYDPNVWEAPAVCAVTSDPTQEGDGDAEGMSLASIATTIVGALIAFLLLAILVAMISRQAAKRSNQLMRQNIALQEQIFEDEDSRRQEWIEYYLASGEIEKAKELGYEEKPEWIKHQEAEAKAEVEAVEALPDALDLDDLL